MADESVRDKIRNLIVEELSIDATEITPNALFIDDLGADSLDQVELIMRIEEEFGVEIPDEDAEKIATVKDAYEYIERVTAK